MVRLGRVYSYIPNKKWDSESILNTSLWDKNMKKIIRKVVRTSIWYINNSKKLLTK